MFYHTLNFFPWLVNHLVYILHNIIYMRMGDQIHFLLEEEPWSFYYHTELKILFRKALESIYYFIKFSFCNNISNKYDV